MFKTSSWIKNDNARIIRRILEINGFCLVGYMNLQCTCNFYILWIDMSTHCFCSLKLCLWWFNICDRFQIWLLPDREHQMRTQYDYFACFQVYNLGTGKGYSVIEMAKAFEEASGKPVSPTYLICTLPSYQGQGHINCKPTFILCEKNLQDSRKYLYPKYYLPQTSLQLPLIYHFSDNLNLDRKN